MWVNEWMGADVTGGTNWEWWKNAEAVHLLSSHILCPGQSAGIISPLLHNRKQSVYSCALEQIFCLSNPPCEQLASSALTSTRYRPLAKVVSVNLERYHCGSHWLESSSRTTRQRHVDDLAYSQKFPLVFVFSLKLAAVEGESVVMTSSLFMEVKAAPNRCGAHEVLEFQDVWDSEDKNRTCKREDVLEELQRVKGLLRGQDVAR